MAKKALKSKWFRVGVEGDTTDGREIQAEWLEQMAKNFNPEKYGCRINCEHIRGLAPDSPFGAFGDVIGLKTETIEIDGKKKLALMAQISPNEDLVALNKKRKKVYTSMEIDFDFAKSGECYLTGLAITDSPASLSTEYLQFAANADQNPLTYRKQKPENVFSAAREVELEFEENASILDRVKELFSKAEAQRTEQDADYTAAIETVASEVAKLQEQFSSLISGKSAGTDHTEQLERLNADVQSAMEKIEQLETALEGTPNFTKRPPASGGNGELKAEF
jgi:hypothetical protein